MSEGSQLVFQEESNLEKNGCSCRKHCPRVLVFFLVLYVVLLVLFLSLAFLVRKQSLRPHIIFVIVDDLGWNDVDWHDADMRTPNLRVLLTSGVFLNNSYAHPLDSPSRAAIFTGLYPFHMGLQHEKMLPNTPSFLPTNVTLLSTRLQDLGYRTHLLGKWHLGFCNERYTPNFRGFHYFTGFYTDDLDYYTHRDNNGSYDFRIGEMVDLDASGTHTTSLLTERARQIVLKHDIAVPLFMVISFQAVHSPVQVPEVYLNKTCGHITEEPRQAMCAITAMVDEGIGNLTSALREKGMISRSVIIVTSDNGGMTSEGSSNGIFRGENGDLYEGGTHVMSLISSESYLSVQDYTYSGLFHQVDWLPTILSMNDITVAENLDGISHWHALQTDSTSPRNELVYNIDETYKNSAIRIDNFKLMIGSTNYSQHPASHAHLSQVHQLYDLVSDPGETVNLTDALPSKVEYLKERLHTIHKTLVPAADKDADPKSNPASHNNIWTFGWC